LKFIRANIKPREEAQREISEGEQPSTSHLRTIEEQEDKQFLEKAQAQLQQHDSSHEKTEEKDVGRTRVLTPDQEFLEQIVPNVTLSGSSPKSPKMSDVSAMNVNMSNLRNSLTDTDLVDSPSEEKNLETEPWKMRVQEDGSVVRKSEDDSRHE